MLRRRGRYLEADMSHRYSMIMIYRLAENCARGAWNQRGGVPELVPGQPVGADWDSLEAMLGGEPSKAEINAFEGAYSRVLAGLRLRDGA